ncbi:MAG: biotin transporter BioY [Pseudomonadota bacterium]
MQQPQPLANALWRSDSAVRHIVLILAASWLVAIAAQIKVPMFPVPISLQTLAILFVGFTLGSRLGAGALIAYVAQGAAGLPVFAGAGLGLATLMGPTGGFIIGFIAMAYIAGRAAETGLASGFVSTALVGVFASAILYVPGILWPMYLAVLSGVDAGWAAQGFGFYWQYFIAPFLLGDAIKAALAALLVAGGWSALKARG